MSVRSVPVFVSHATEERELAGALADLLGAVSLGAVSCWYSSDQRPTGGIDAGLAWRTALIERLEEAEAVLAVQTPLSLGRPWVMWECALASGTGQELGETEGRGRRVIPVVFGLGLAEVSNPLNLYQGYDGTDRDAVRQLCERLVHAAGLSVNGTVLDHALDAYEDAVALHGPRPTVPSERMELWRGRFEDLVRTGRSSEVLAARDMMYATLGSPFTPSDPSVHELLSRVLIDENRFAEAVEEVDHAVSRVGDDPQLLHRKALALTELGDHHTARGLLEHLYEQSETLRTNPELAGLEGRIHRERWESSHDRADLEAAATAYLRAYDANPADYYPGVNAASLLLELGELGEAQGTYARVLERCRSLQERPRASFWIDFTAAEALTGMGRLDEAVGEYGRGLHRVPPPSPRDRGSALKGFERLAARLGLGDDESQVVRDLLGE